MKTIGMTFISYCILCMDRTILGGMIITMVFILSIWYLAKICTGATREAINEIKQLRKEIKIFNQMENDLSQFGKVEQFEEIDGMFHVRITEGFTGNAIKTFKCMEMIDNLTDSKYPTIHKMDSDTGNFHLILKAKN